jgi:hypothetical protein
VIRNQQFLGFLVLVAAGLVWLGGGSRVSLHARKRLGRFNRLNFDLRSRYVPIRELDKRERRWLLLLYIVFVVLGLLGTGLLNGAFR